MQTFIVEFNAVGWNEFIHSSLTPIIGFLVMFSSVFLKGFQHQNVIGGHYTWAFIVSYLMAIFDILAVSLVVTRGWDMVMPYGTGAALGIITSMYLHRKFLKEGSK